MELAECWCIGLRSWLRRLGNIKTQAANKWLKINTEAAIRQMKKVIFISTDLTFFCYQTSSREMQQLEPISRVLKRVRSFHANYL